MRQAFAWQTAGTAQSIIHNESRLEDVPIEIAVEIHATVVVCNAEIDQFWVAQAGPARIPSRQFCVQFIQTFAQT